MGRIPPLPRRPAGGTRKSTLVGTAAGAMAALALTVSCSPGVSPAGVPAAAPTAAAPASPVTAEINQLRDDYSHQIIAIQLTNTTSDRLTVLGARLASPLYAGAIEWQATPGGIELPPGQTKALPAQLRAPQCGARTAGPGEGAAVALQLAESTGTRTAATVGATDPYGVLGRNNAEMCLAQAAAAVADIRLDPVLEVAADARSAVLGLAITPRHAPGAVNPDSTGTLTINRVDGTTLLDEDPGVPWPRSVSVSAGGPSQHFRLGIRPARCDPHAIADDKVGTLLPLRVTAGGRDGVLKIDAGPLLRGRIYEFITTSCGRQ
ncbi:MAG: hypothetical protein ABWX85_10390 [Arthrobacter sp.]